MDLFNVQEGSSKSQPLPVYTVVIFSPLPFGSWWHWRRVVGVEQCYELASLASDVPRRHFKKIKTSTDFEGWCNPLTVFISLIEFSL